MEEKQAMRLEKTIELRDGVKVTVRELTIRDVLLLCPVFEGEAPLRQRLLSNFDLVRKVIASTTEPSQDIESLGATDVSRVLEGFFQVNHDFFFNSQAMMFLMALAAEGEEEGERMGSKHSSQEPSASSPEMATEQ